tara:strand:- start:785 stop:955 length:171 start_codon:yes stop_codon:yes gene_type:complete
MKTFSKPSQARQAKANVFLPSKLLNASIKLEWLTQKSWETLPSITKLLKATKTTNL